MKPYVLQTEEGEVLEFDTLESLLKLIWWCEALPCTVTIIEV